MRTPLLIAGLLGLICPPVRAGLYLPAEKGYWRVPTKPRQYRIILDDRQSLLPAVDPNADPKAEKPFYAKQVHETAAALEKKFKEGQITIEEGVSLGGYYILLNQPDNAILIMEAMYKREKKDFMVIANLAMAYYARGILDRADTYQSELVMPSKWPKKYKDWPAERLRWQLRAEQLFLTMQSQRGKELLAGGGLDLKLDTLFAGARFEGPDGKYAAGQTDSETEDALPPDAAEVIQQILLWMPQDDRLQWLLAEIYNARGETQEAMSLMSKLVNKGLTSEKLREHRHVLEVAALPKDPAPDVPDVPPWQADLRSIGVGGGIGLVVGMLVVFQVLQLFRRAP